jgi:hypothetical protein
MHHPGVIVGVTEIIPNLCQITRFCECIEKMKSEASLFISRVNPQKKFNNALAEAIIMSLLIVNIKLSQEKWEKYVHDEFPVLPKKSTFLQPGVHFSNPYLPDTVLKELYIPFDQTNEGNYKSLGVNLEMSHYFNDPSFSNDGMEILYRLLRVILLDSRISKAWWQSGRRFIN